ncbi:MAG: hypothetical protein P8Z42_03625 [Anaerolineales bacterium]
MGLDLYSTDEILEIAGRSSFVENASIEKSTLQNLLIFLRIRLMKVE